MIIREMLDNIGEVELSIWITQSIELLADHALWRNGSDLLRRGNALLFSPPMQIILKRTLRQAKVTFQCLQISGCRQPSISISKIAIGFVKAHLRIGCLISPGGSCLGKRDQLIVCLRE